MQILLSLIRTLNQLKIKTQMQFNHKLLKTLSLLQQATKIYRKLRFSIMNVNLTLAMLIGTTRYQAKLQTSTLTQPLQQVMSKLYHFQRGRMNY